MSSYIEQEIKVLDIDVKKLQKALEKLGAKKVFDDDRIFTTFDSKDKKFRKSNKIIRLTEEGKLKLSISTSENGTKETVKVFTSKKKETIDFLFKLDIFPISEIKSHRISYELGKVDLDIDIFQYIPPFLEIDLEHLEISLDELIKKLGLKNNRIVNLGTEEIFKEYGKDYFELSKIRKSNKL